MAKLPAPSQPEADNRQLLLNQALGLFARRGYDAVGVQEIVGAAGLTKPTLYHYFGSKLGLLDALLSQWGDPLLARLGRAAAYQGDVPLSLERLAFCLRDEARLAPDFYRFLLALEQAPAESEAAAAGAGLVEAIRARLAASFEAARDQLGNMHGRHALFGASFLGVINTWIGMELRGLLRLDDPELRQVLRQFMYGIHS